MGGEGEQAAAAMAAGRDNNKSSFAVTCSLLSQYLKEKKGGLQGLDGLDMAPPPAAAGPGAFRPPTTMNLLSALDAPAERKDAEKATAGEKATTKTEPPALVAPTHQLNGENPREETGEEAQQLTIFYGGKVVVFDSFPATNVKELLHMVNSGHGVDKGSINAAAPPKPSHNISDMPIARRNSLHRFLEKRKGRIISNAPYQVDTSVEASKKQPTDEKSWLGLGQEQEVSVKQEEI